MTQPVPMQDLINSAVLMKDDELATDQPAAPAPSVHTDVINAAIGMPETDVTISLRTAIGAIKDQPERQLQYLKNKGFDADMDEDGNIMIGVGNGKRERFNPEGFDFGDVAEYLPEIFEAVASTIGTGAKAMGAMGAPLTGGLSVAAGAGVSGAIAGAAELGTQALGKATGVREEFNLAEVGRKAAIGTVVPPAIEGLGRVIKGGFQAGSKAMFGAKTGVRKPIDKPGIEAAQELIGGKATPGMLTRDKAIRETESLLSKQPLGLGGTFVRKQMSVNKEARIAAAEGLVANKTGRSAGEVGKSFKKNIIEDVANKLKPAEKLYEEVAKATGDIGANTSSVTEVLAKLGPKANLSPSSEVSNLLLKVEEKLPLLKSVDDIKTFRTNLMRSISPTASPDIRAAADEIYSALTKARSDSFTSGVRNLKGQFQPAAMTKLLGKIKEADGIYSDTARLVQTALLAEGKKLKGGVKHAVREALKIDSEKAVKEFLPTQGSVRTQALEQLSKRGFDDLVSGKLADIAKKASTGEFGEVNPLRIAKEVGNVAPELAKQIWGKDGVEIAKALEKTIRAMPKDLNPSGSATTADLILAFTGLRQASSISISMANQVLRGNTPINKTALFLALTKATEDIAKEDFKSSPTSEKEVFNRRVK